MASKTDTTTARTLPDIPLTTIIRLAFTYFGVVFATGFIFGTIRQLYIIPTYHLPSSNAKIIEAPVMFIAILFWANWLVDRYKIPSKAIVRLSVGLLGLGVMACVEFIGTRFVGERGLVEESEQEERAGVARTLYLFDLAVFGIMPWILMLMEKDQGKRKANDCLEQE